MLPFNSLNIHNAILIVGNGLLLSHTACYRSTLSTFTMLSSDLEYKFCYEEKKATYSQCKDSCEAMNTADKTGWSLATVPTWGYNQKVVAVFNNSATTGWLVDGRALDGKWPGAGR